MCFFQEFSIPDKVKTVEWIGTQNLCMGFDNEYALMDCKTGVLTPLFSPTSPSLQGALGATFETTLSTLNNLSSMATGGLMGFGSKPGKPLITRLPNDEILLGKESKGYSIRIQCLGSKYNLYANSLYPCRFKYLCRSGWNAKAQEWNRMVRNTGGAWILLSICCRHPTPPD